MADETIAEMLNRIGSGRTTSPQTSDFNMVDNNYSSLIGNGQGAFRPPAQAITPAVPEDDGWFQGLGGMEGISSGMEGLASLGNFGLGIANYFSNKSNFDKMMRFQEANFQQQKNAAALNAGSEMDRINRNKGGSISPRTQAAYDKVLPRI